MKRKGTLNYHLVEIPKVVKTGISFTPPDPCLGSLHGDFTDLILLFVSFVYK